MAVVIAIDFGTTFSGYAFSWQSHRADITMNKNWGADAGFVQYKTPTSILLHPDGSLKSFGFDAEDDFINLSESELEEGYQLFKRFKMELYANKKLKSDMTIKSTRGEERPAMDIVTLALAFMKEHSLEAISSAFEKQNSGYGTEAIQDICWVITVPAIWSDTAKKFMRLAAKQAGLVDDILSQNLIIALEPEAASLYCRTLAFNQFVGMDGKEGAETMEPGENYIIVDCGGGTIDIAVHEVLEEGKVQEKRGASGGPWGGIYVDQRFYSLLDNIFGANFIRALKKDHPTVWQRMVVEFETMKRAVKPGGPGINMTLSLQFANAFENYAHESVIDRIAKKKQLGVTYSNGFLKISDDVFKKMYSEVLPKIKDHLHNLLAQFHEGEITKMFVVGGFAESSYVQECLIKEFGDKITVLIPEEAGMSIMKGAVLFGHDTDIITSRIARFHYSISTYSDFIPEQDDPARREIIRGKARILTLLPFISKGEQVNVDDVLTHTIKPLDRRDDVVAIDMYSTEEDTDNPNHTSARLLETIFVESPDTDIENRPIEVSMKFGGTDILCYAVDIESGNEAWATIEL